MNYTPRFSNFTDFQDEILESVKAAHATDEAIKDAIAKEIDSFVESIMNDVIKNLRFSCVPEDGRLQVYIYLMENPTISAAGEKFIDCFSINGWLDEIIGKPSDSLSAVYFNEATDAEKLAEQFESYARQLRAVAQEIKDEESE